MLILYIAEMDQQTGLFVNKKNTTEFKFKLFFYFLRITEMDVLTEEQKKKVLDKEVVTQVVVIAQICKIIEGCTQRGAFRPDELTYVGGMFDNLSKVVNDAILQVKEEVGGPATIHEVEVDGEEEK